ncbi:alpha/beta fold hydrolase [Jatrophihabitans fulvus]
MTLDGLAAFRAERIAAGGTDIAVRTAGSGPPVVLLHGYPQTHVMWHHVAPALAETHTVVLPDLRGYGDSAKPGGGERHEAYAKRTMAADIAVVMTALGHDRFAVVGHDRGARVAHRLCLDHPDRVTRAAVLDIVPTRHVYATADRALGLAYYHWFFLAQPYDHPERLIGADPERWVTHHLASWSRVPDAFDPLAVSEYVRAFSDPDAIRASCEDYRAGADIDIEHDDQSYELGERVRCPLLVLWGADGFVGRNYDVLGVWSEYALEVGGQALDCGHFVPEERPAETLAALQRFLA